jgi:hypothetical protein
MVEQSGVIPSFAIDPVVLGELARHFFPRPTEAAICLIAYMVNAFGTPDERGVAMRTTGISTADGRQWSGRFRQCGVQT